MTKAARSRRQRRRPGGPGHDASLEGGSPAPIRAPRTRERTKTARSWLDPEKVEFLHQLIAYVTVTQPVGRRRESILEHWRDRYGEELTRHLLDYHAYDPRQAGARRAALERAAERSVGLPLGAHPEGWLAAAYWSALTLFESCMVVRLVSCQVVHVRGEDGVYRDEIVRFEDIDADGAGKAIDAVLKAVELLADLKCRLAEARALERASASQVATCQQSVVDPVAAVVRKCL